MPLSYASLAEMKDELKAVGNVDDVKLLNNGRQASARIDRLFRSLVPFFFPTIKNLPVPVTSTAVNSTAGTLSIPANLLALTSLTAGDVAVTAVEVYPPYTSPSRALRLTADCHDTWYSYQPCCGKPLLAVINGIFGFHRDYANAWLKVDDLAAAITTTTALTFTVADVDGADAYGRTPRISAGNLLRIDTEFFEVISTNSGSNTVTVRRGANGSTAATHLIGADVEVWQVEEPIKRAVARQASFMYARKGTYESAMITDLGMIQFPADLLSEVYGVVQGYT